MTMDPLLQLDVKFEESLSKEQCWYVTNELMKNLIFQRRQIPLTFETLKREIRDFTSLQQQSTENSPLDPAQNQKSIRQLVRERKDKIRRDKLKEKLIKRAQKALQAYEKVEVCIKNAVLQSENAVSHLAIIFGISPLAPKEVYLMSWPKDLSSKNHSALVTQRRMISLFRSLMMNDGLFDRVSQELTLTNIFFGLKMASTRNQGIEHFTSYPDFETWPQKAKVTLFTFCHHQSKSEAVIVGQDTYTPSSMELCTPYIGRSSGFQGRKRSVSGSSFSNEFMIETPCQKTNKSWSMERIQEDFSNMDINQSPSPLNFCHPNEMWYFCDLPLKGFRDPHLAFSE